MPKVFTKSCLFIVCKTIISSYFSCKQNSKHKNAKFSILAGEDLTPKNLHGARTTTWNSYSRAQATKMETALTNSGAEGTSLNECRMLKYFTSKWKWFWIISLNISANIAVTKHALLADEFIPYRSRLLGFHSLHVNAMKCICVGVSLSKLQSFFLKNIFEFTFNKAPRL